MKLSIECSGRSFNDTVCFWTIVCVLNLLWYYHYDYYKPKRLWNTKTYANNMSVVHALFANQFREMKYLIKKKTQLSDYGLAIFKKCNYNYSFVNDFGFLRIQY